VQFVFPAAVASPFLPLRPVYCSCLAAVIIIMAGMPAMAAVPPMAMAGTAIPDMAIAVTADAIIIAVTAGTVTVTEWRTPA